MRILVLNVGSSTIKFQLIDTDGAAIAAASDKRLARGQLERIGGEAIVALDHAKWHKMPGNWDPKSPGGIPSATWNTLPSAATTGPTAQFQQWFPWTEGAESW